MSSCPLSLSRQQSTRKKSSFLWVCIYFGKYESHSVTGLQPTLKPFHRWSVTQYGTGAIRWKRSGPSAGCKQDKAAVFVPTGLEAGSSWARSRAFPALRGERDRDLGIKVGNLLMLCLCSLHILPARLLPKFGGFLWGEEVLGLLEFATGLWKQKGGSVETTDLTY